MQLREISISELLANALIDKLDSIKPAHKRIFVFKTTSIIKSLSKVLTVYILVFTLCIFKVGRFN
jgi:hypothetical protein